MAKETVSLTSSWLSSVTWNSDDGSTEVTFNDGFVWTGNMSYDEFDDLSHTASPGKWWHANIMGR